MWKICHLFKLNRYKSEIGALTRYIEIDKRFRFVYTVHLPNALKDGEDEDAYNVRDLSGKLEIYPIPPFDSVEPRRNRKIREPTEAIGGGRSALSARLPVQLFAQRSAYFSDPRLSASTRRWCLGFVALVVRFRSVHFVPLSVTIPPPSLLFVPPRPPPLAAFKVGAPRTPENFLIDPRTSCALYSTCDSSSPLLISSPLPRQGARYRSHDGTALSTSPTFSSLAFIAGDRAPFQVNFGNEHRRN